MALMRRSRRRSKECLYYWSVCLLNCSKSVFPEISCHLPFMSSCEDGTSYYIHFHYYKSLLVVACHALL